ncbi:DNA-binding transcriptional regulator, MerR family [Amycolatopsis lurida]|uniref:MerR family transcriptional regulator n=1 Tax=Amycolatopsis lurida NRRL 2430 TaxID=1460371 RepID=A0A2P2FJL6_AMYLU|nr:MerR family transcriptional regulator [Amycolatopsis lurida]KFU76918.1 MerR family transcriptional regulator [Amycolatopsis lurida NRRL 2430]SED07095.1 DNA-binding transcriptional regulator, MerR family [Amycolatopsis lurida]
MTSGLTIGQAAAFAGVTVKTVRHYHRLGLIEEPLRDSLGYRRYGSTDVLRLVQVRTLAEAGVPLAEIDTMLGADPHQFATHLAEVKQQLTDRIQDLVARRDMVDRLAAGNRLLLPDRACALLDRAAHLGFPPDYLAQSRESLVLAKALVPWDFDDFLTQIEHSLDDAQYVALLKRTWEAGAWEPDDPRVADLATAVTDHLLANPELLAIPSSLQGRTDTAVRFGLINDYQARIAPAWNRLTALIEANLRSADIDIRGTRP